MDDLWIKNDGSILKLDQILLPNSLQKKAVKFAHEEGHLGMVLTKRLLWSRVCFFGQHGRNQSGRLFAMSGKYGHNRARSYHHPRNTKEMHQHGFLGFQQQDTI